MKLRRQVPRDQQRFDRRQELHGRPTRLLLYAKITKRFSLVRECNVFLQCYILTLGPVRQCLKIITDGYLQIQNYKIEMQLKPKLHQLWRIALCFGNYKLQLSVFLKTVWVFWPERVVPPRGNSLWTVLLLPLCDQIACYVPTDVNQTCQQSVFSPIGACIRIWCTAGTVERRSQRFVYRPFRFSLSPPRSTKGLFSPPLSLPFPRYFSPNREPVHRLQANGRKVISQQLPTLLRVIACCSE